jgi:putative oxidoreductase
VAIIALWLTQIVPAAMLLFAGGSKLVGAPAMVNLFAAIASGQWLRYVTGAIEISATVALLIPPAALFTEARGSCL